MKKGVIAVISTLLGAASGATVAGVGVAKAKGKEASDQNRHNVKTEIEVKSMEDDLEEVDAVIVTPIFYFNSIEEKLEEIFDCPIISFEEVLEHME